MLGYHAERGGGDVGDQDLVLLYRQLQPGLEIVLNPLVDNPDRLRLDNPRLLEGPEQLAHGLGSVLDQEHDQLALLLRHNLYLSIFITHSLSLFIPLFLFAYLFVSLFLTPSNFFHLPSHPLSIYFANLPHFLFSLPLCCLCL